MSETDPHVNFLEETTTTYDERCLIQHTLGLDRSRIAYRNYFSADQGHRDVPTLNALVERGLMVRETSAISPGFIFRVTAEGKKALHDHFA